MTQLVIEDLEEDVRDRLLDLARDHGRTVEEEVRGILREAVAEQPAGNPKPGLGTRIAARFSGRGIGLTADEAAAMELRGHFTPRPLDFDP